MPVSDIERANADYPVWDALTAVGSQAVDSSNRKQHCPFETFHSDFGDSAALRVYSDTNTAYCFACGELYTPVKVIAKAEGVSAMVAAEGLLIELGYVEPNLDEKWELALQHEHPLDLGPMQEAFRRACSRIVPDWSLRQYDDDVAEWFDRCLKLLNKVKTLEDGEKWLKTVKQVMTQKFGPKETHHGDS